MNNVTPTDINASIELGEAEECPPYGRIPHGVQIGEAQTAGPTRERGVECGIRRSWFTLKARTRDRPREKK